MKPLFPIVFFSLLLVLSGCSLRDDLTVYDLRCENFVNPLAVDKTSPRFGWKVQSKKNGAVQEKFQILVASALELLDEDGADLWDSGITVSSSSVFVPYKGKPLDSGMLGYWKVRIWDQDGRSSGWSEPARFGVGLLNEEDWQAEYIAFDTENGYLECPQVSGTFEAAGERQTTILHVNSLGYHEVWFNGAPIGREVLTPAVSQFDKRSLVNSYDITSLVKSGTNEILIWLGSGWYTEGLPGVVNNGPVVRAQVMQVSGQEKTVVAATGDSWKGRRSGYTRHGNWRSNRFGGEIVDGSMNKSAHSVEEQPGNPWSPVTLKIIPAHVASPQMVESNAITDTISPSAIIQMGRDTFLADMGQHLTG